eukprot:GFUD01002909.1.p1 GENE.GFUD01002909.1~~GFUD01002909.1.p1  ORF type:complete len:401 (+),score=146.07 GFUD01002909.1:65-1267(+)
MPPKKKDVVEEKMVLVGRMGTNLKCGIVGLPNVGKSTFFNVLTKTSIAAAENFPFCTIDPNDARVPVPDSRFDWLVDHHKPASKVPAFLNVTDIAGLVKGASEGQGLGNAFLGHIRACDALFHLCRTFEDPAITHVEGEVDPVRDLDIINEELRLKDEEFFEKIFEEVERKYVRGGEKSLKAEYEVLCKFKKMLLEDKKHLRFGDWNQADIEVLNKHLFITSKPMLYLINLSEKDFMRKKNKWLPKIKEYVDKNDPGAMIIPFSGAFEQKLMDMESEDDKKAYMEETKCTTILDKIIVQGYKALQLQYFFTAGPDEVKAWTIQKGCKAPQAAGKIHTDFEKGFIMAEVMKFDEYKEHGSEAGVKAAGGYRQQGKNYTVMDGDIIFFKFNAGAGLTAAKKK